jgi:transcriptional regulator with XRE-family HTH domain
MRLQGHLMTGRKRLGLKQNDVAAHLQVSRSTFQRWELGHSVPDALQLFRWASLLGVEITSAESVRNDAAQVPA